MRVTQVGQTKNSKSRRDEHGARMKETKKCSRREFMRLDGAFEVALRDITGLHRNIPISLKLKSES